MAVERNSKYPLSATLKAPEATKIIHQGDFLPYPFGKRRLAPRKKIMALIYKKIIKETS